MYSLILLVFICGSIVVISQKAHLISVFIGLEFMVLSILFLSSMMMFYNVSVVFLIMCLGVCEASVCLALLVMMVRLCGNDLVSNLSSF